MAAIEKRLLLRRFDVVARFMGWDIDSPMFATKAPDMSMTVGRVFLHKFGRANAWQINQIMNARGGEKPLCEVYTDKEMLAYLDGIMAAGNAHLADRMGNAWVASNNHFASLPE